MAAPVGGANEDGDGRINRNELGSTAEHEYCATARLRGAAHGGQQWHKSIGSGTH
jgi:hypothetical protein